VPTMSGNVNVRSWSSQGLSIYELAYAGGALAIDVLLPDGLLSALEASLTPDGLSAALAKLGPPQQQPIFLPKFSFSTRLALAPVLASMGMRDVFDPSKANLSGMDGKTDLYVGAVVHQALVQVDEQGTIAVAATAAGVDTFLAVTPVAIDHPFLFLIRDTKNGSILFMGRLEDPRQGS